MLFFNWRKKFKIMVCTMKFKLDKNQNIKLTPDQRANLKNALSSQSESERAKVSGAKMHAIYWAKRQLGYS